MLRLQPYNQPGKQDICFKLDGLDAAIRPLFDACGWDPTKPAQSPGGALPSGAPDHQAGEQERMIAALSLVFALAGIQSADVPSPKPPWANWTANHLMGNVILRRNASNLLNREPGVDVRPDLAFLCDPEKSLSAEVSGFMVGIQKRNPVVIPLSLDGGPFSEIGATGIGAGFYFDEPKALIRRILGHRWLLLRVRPYGQAGTQDIRFELEGFDRVAGALFEACNWDPTKHDRHEEPSSR
jgi:hypothetical protein